MAISHRRFLFSCSNPTFFAFLCAKESGAKQTANSAWIIVAFVLAALVTFGLSATPVQAQTDNSQSSTSQGNEAAGQTLDEVVVTAQKRQERLQDVPIPVSVVSAAALRDNNQVRIQDYYAEVPGLAMAQSTMGTNTVSIRGITTGAVGSGPPAPSPTVGVVVDDVPFGGVGGGDQFIPDFDPGDLQRIEVLRGPQGTLYGASSLGGLIKYVTVDPSTDSLSGRMEAGTTSVHNGAELGYTFRASVNVPISSDLALRVSAFTRQDPGYIDNPVLHINGVNEDHVSGGHIVALWTPLENLSIKVNALYQQDRAGADSAVTPNLPSYLGVPAKLGSLQQFFIPGSSYSDSTNEAFSAAIKYKTGSVELNSLTGYTLSTTNSSLDFSSAFPALTQAQFGVVGDPQRDHSNITRFTQELRASSPLGSYFDGLLGVFYSHEADHWRFGPFLAENPTSGAIVGTWGVDNPAAAPITYNEDAVFADVTFHPTDKFNIQVGGRYSQFSITPEPLIVTGPLSTVVLGFPTENYSPYDKFTVNEHAPTYLFTPQYKISPDFMIYTRFASGFREGGTNAGTANVPLVVKPDKTEDYDVGLKGDFLNHKISVDASLYYIDWKNIQLPLLNAASFSYIGNGGAAESKGAELSVQVTPVSNLKVAAWASWDQAVITKSAAGFFANPGAPLPNTPRFSGNVSVTENFAMTQDVNGFVGATTSYVGNREDIFLASAAPRQYLPAYAKLDLRSGVNYESWTVNFTINNAADRRGVVSGGTGNTIPYAFYLIQPRTFGLSVVKAFGKQ